MTISEWLENMATIEPCDVCAGEATMALVRWNRGCMSLSFSCDENLEEAKRRMEEQGQRALKIYPAFGLGSLEVYKVKPTTNAQ